MEKDICPEDIDKMNYVQFISLLRETNRCPGGKQTIQKIIQNSFIESGSQVLEIGCNTGFTSLEIARTRKCRVTGIDPVKEAVETAKLQLSLDTDEIKNLVDFREGSALEIEFPDNTFDLVVTGGATSFIDQKQKAIDEYYRVLKPWGFLSVTNLCYMEAPPAKIVNDVSDLLGVKINAWGPDEWMNVFSKQEKFEIYQLEKYKLFQREQKFITDYIDIFMGKEHMQLYSENTKEAIKERWLKTISVFNENHKYLGFIMVLFRKSYIQEESELFSKFKKI